MAQEIGYYDDNVAFKEGPFVIVNVGSRIKPSWRIEAELVGHTCPVLPDASIFTILRRSGMHFATPNKRLAMRVCDHLNKMVRDGEIVRKGGVWVVNEENYAE